MHSFFSLSWKVDLPAFLLLCSMPPYFTLTVLCHPGSSQLSPLPAKAEELLWFSFLTTMQTFASVNLPHRSILLSLAQIIVLIFLQALQSCLEAPVVPSLPKAFSLLVPPPPCLGLVRLCSQEGFYHLLSNTASLHPDREPGIGEKDSRKFTFLRSKASQVEMSSACTPLPVKAPELSLWLTTRNNNLFPE